MEKIGIKFDTNSMLTMLSKSLYDSPLVFLRENLQNAYDAALMRKHKDASFTNPEIYINVDEKKIVIVDNGIGMNKEELQDNYWTAGKSGKNNQEARDAGVVGTFGIGALANFGVCQILEITTHRYDNQKAYYCRAVKDDYDNIEIYDSDSTVIGTTVIATLQEGKSISVSAAMDYVVPFVQYLDIPVYFNGTLISQNSYKQAIPDIEIKECCYNTASYSFVFKYAFSFEKRKNYESKIYIKDICFNGHAWKGDILLYSDVANIFGMRNGFGLANIPLSTSFQLGGLVNLDMLIPTAGREAINRTCVDQLQYIINKVENLFAQSISSNPLVDDYTLFLNYLNAHFSMDLVDHVTIAEANNPNSKIPFATIKQSPMNYRYYDGTNTDYLRSFIGSEFHVITVTREYPRRELQRTILSQLGVERLVEQAGVDKIFDFISLPTSYFTLAYEIRKVLEKDYLILHNEVYFGVIKLGASIFVEKDKNDVVNVYLADTTEVKALLSIRDSSNSIFVPMVKDFVRNYIYQQIAPYIPSSSKEGIEQVCNFLKQNQENLEIYQEDIGAIDVSYDLFRENKITADELADRIKRNSTVSNQKIERDQIDDVAKIVQTADTQIMPQPGTQSAAQIMVQENLLEPLPSIMRQNIKTEAKLLETTEDSPLLHNYKRFLSVTPKMYNENLSFFFYPHTTRAIWSMHRIIYIFSLRDGMYNLYYDMELTKHIDSNLTGGEAMFSTTIITKNKLFIPIPPPLYDYFTVKEEPLKFSIRCYGKDGSEG